MPIDDEASFAALLKRHRVAAGLSQEALAECAGLSSEAISTLERGRRHTPRRDTVRLLARALDLSADEYAQLEHALNRRRGPISTASTAERLSAATAVSATTPQPRNPFFHRGPIRDPAFFFGRHQELQVLGDLLHQGQSIALTGARRLGKTSLLFYLMNATVSAPYGLGPDTTCWAYLDGGMLDGLEEEWFYGAVERALGGDVDLVPYARFVERLREVAVRGQRLVLLLDEFEVVAANPHLGRVLFNRLRGLAARFPLQFVTASRTTLLDLSFAHPDTLGSPFFNIFAPVRLPLLREAEARELLATLSGRGGRPFNPGTLAWLLALVGRHPLFLQVAGYHTFAALDNREADDALIDEGRWATIRARTRDDLEQHLRYYWSLLDAEDRYALATLPLLDPAYGSAALERLALSGMVADRSYAGGVVNEFVRRQTVQGLLQAGPILLDMRRRLVAISGTPVYLARTEFDALQHFLQQVGRLLSVDEIERRLWPHEYAADPERVRGVVKKLRAALGPAGALIHTRRGQGYVLDAPDAASPGSVNVP